MRVFLQALGCRLNEAERERWTRDCRAHGFRLAADAAQADLVVINTCAVTAESVRKSRQLVRRAQRANPRAKLVVSGCYASLAAADIGAELGVDLVVSNQEKDRLIPLVAERLDLPVMPAIATRPGEHALPGHGRHRAFVKVQDGCRYRCAFCIVTKARGEERSRPVTEIIEEINALQAGGVQEAVLAGVHLGGYRSDSGGSLGNLVHAVLAETSIPRLRLGSLEPWELAPDFWSLFDDPRLLPHLHLPIQSGANSVLRRMSRRCRSDEFRGLVTQARQAVPGMNITTDIIVGFPGETDAEWQETLDLAADMGFGDIHIFAYSPRAGTKAAAMPDQVAHEVKRARSGQLHDLARRSRRRVLEAARGQDFEVLIEGRGEQREGVGARWSGYTPNYLRVEIGDTRRDLDNQIVSVRADGLSDDGERLTARLLAKPA